MFTEVANCCKINGFCFGTIVQVMAKAHSVIRNNVTADQLLSLDPNSASHTEFTHLISSKVIFDVLLALTMVSIFWCVCVCVVVCPGACACVDLQMLCGFSCEDLASMFKELRSLGVVVKELPNELRQLVSRRSCGCEPKCSGGL